MLNANPADYAYSLTFTSTYMNVLNTIFIYTDVLIMFLCSSVLTLTFALF
jgi:hypothetical protein